MYRNERPFAACISFFSVPLFLGMLNYGTLENLHLWFQFNGKLLKNSLLHLFHESYDFRSSGLTGINNKIGMNRRNHSTTATNTFKTGCLNQSACRIPFRILSQLPTISA